MEHDARIEALETRLRVLSARMEEVEHRLRQSPPKTRDACREELHELTQRRKQAEQQLADYRIQGTGSFENEDLLDGIFNVLDDIGGRVDRLISRLSGVEPGT